MDDRITLIIIYILFLFTDRHLFFKIIYSCLLICNMYYLSKNKFDIKLKQWIILIFSYICAHYLIEDPNPFYYLLTFYLPLPNFFRAVFIIILNSYIFNKYIVILEIPQEQIIDNNKKEKKEIKEQNKDENMKEDSNKTEELEEENDKEGDSDSFDDDEVQEISGPSEDNNSDIRPEDNVQEEPKIQVDPSHVDEVTQIVDKNPRITLWSSRSAAVLRYLRKTEPEFSISKEASTLIDEAVSKKYPDIWELFDQY